MIHPDEKARLIARAQDLASKLGAFRTPNTGEPVDPSIVGAMHRFFQVAPEQRAVEAFLGAFGASAVATLTKSTLPQARERGRLVQPLWRDVGGQGNGAEAMAYVLGWTGRLMRTQERGGRSDGPRDDRRPGNRS